MLEFAVTNVLMISIGAILYMVVRTLPRVSENGASSDRKTIFERWILSEIPDRLDAATRNFLGKFFRRTKVLLMRIDNILTEKIKQTRTENGNGKTPAYEFKDIVKEKQENRENNISPGSLS